MSTPKEVAENKVETTKQAAKSTPKTAKKKSVKMVNVVPLVPLAGKYNVASKLGKPVKMEAKQAELAIDAGDVKKA
ncbi:hypothetical protein I5168_11940 [Nonlabens sp. SCSIO 43208]|uniref:hypothetical protein n=1 Tax=Nonlabens sp. SCSIO 43208 TaxID=2793009 RepID=UPI003D6A7F2B